MKKKKKKKAKKPEQIANNQEAINNTNSTGLSNTNVHNKDMSKIEKKKTDDPELQS